MQSVTSKDGTKIAYEKVGSGPAVLLVEGATATRSASESLANLLSSHFTVYYYDRRGRGDSGDTLPFSLEKEINDIEALIDVAGGSVFLYGISSGGALALEAALALSGKVMKLAIYEVPYDDSEAGINAWHEYRRNLSEAIAADKHGEAVTIFMKFVGVPDEMINNMRQAPFWQGIETIAPTLLYDAAALGDDRTIPSDRVAKINVPTFIMDGEGSKENMPFMYASAESLGKSIPHAQRKTLEGQTHNVDMNVLAPVLIEFFKG